MKLLLTADLHYRLDWYEWLLKNAPAYDAVAVAGDLLDMSQDLPPQIEFLRGWVAKMKLAGTPLFLCDGNHDFNSTALPWPKNPNERPSPEQAAFDRRARLAEHWMDALVGEGASIVSGMVKVFPELDNLIVSSLFYDLEDDDVNCSLFEKGAQLRRASPRSPWLVLHHEPPIGLIGDVGLGNRLLGAWIEEFQPKLVLSGHDHKTPFVKDTCRDRIGLTYVFNPGHHAPNNYPCHILLDTQTMRYQWQR
jgi:Icc-related predicted phosphoesterase